MTKVVAVLDVTATLVRVAAVSAWAVSTVPLPPVA